MLDQDGTDVVDPRRVDADQAQRRLEGELDQLLRLADDVGVGFVLAENIQDFEADGRLGQVAARKLVAGQSSTTCPGRTLGSRTQYLAPRNDLRSAPRRLSRSRTPAMCASIRPSRS